MHTQAASVEVDVLVPQTNPNIPWFYLYHTGAITVGYEFTSFVVTEPPADDFAIPKGYPLKWQAVVSCGLTERDYRVLLLHMILLVL